MVKRFLSKVGRSSGRKSGGSEGDTMRILKKGHAMRVIFFYPGEEGTYVDNAEVTLYENGIIHIRSAQEETTTHLQNCEILWRFEIDAEDRANKLRLLKPKGDGRMSGATDELDMQGEMDSQGEMPEKPEKDRPGKGTSKNPELR